MGLVLSYSILPSLCSCHPIWSRLSPWETTQETVDQFVGALFWLRSIFHVRVRCIKQQREFLIQMSPCRMFFVSATANFKGLPVTIGNTLFFTWYLLTL